MILADVSDIDLGFTQDIEASRLRSGVGSVH